MWANAPESIIRDDLEGRKRCVHEMEARPFEDLACFHASYSARVKLILIIRAAGEVRVTYPRAGIADIVVETPVVWVDNGDIVARQDSARAIKA